MEKQKPHFPLATVQAIVRAGNVRITLTAQRSASAFGFYKDDICRALLALTGDAFYKSMTAYTDATTWQDVYRHQTPAGIVYIKLTILDEVLVLSFKEL